MKSPQKSPNGDHGQGSVDALKRVWIHTVCGCLVTTAGLISVSGCASQQGILGTDCCADIPSGALPNPLGSFVCQWTGGQVASAAADRYVFYQADFLGNSEDLSPAAISRLSELVQQGQGSDVLDLIVEPSSTRELDSRRTSVIADAATRLGWEGQVQVTLGDSQAIALRGSEAERIGRTLSAPRANGGNANSAGVGNFGNTGQFGRGVSNVGGFF